LRKIGSKRTNLEQGEARKKKYEVQSRSYVGREKGSSREPAKDTPIANLEEVMLSNDQAPKITRKKASNGASG